jgi:hypothetical protein
MRRTRIGALIILACVAAGGCGDGSTSTDDPPPGGASEVDSTATHDGSGLNSGGADSGGDNGGGGVDGGEPGVPGSPIDYDHTVKQAGPQGAKDDIESKIRAQCGPDLCGVNVVYAGKGPCVLSITPPPVHSGGTVTLKLGDCEYPPEPKPEPEPEPEPEPDTGGTTTEAG